MLIGKNDNVALRVWQSLSTEEKFTLAAERKTFETVTLGDLERVRAAFRAVFAPSAQELS